MNNLSTIIVSIFLNVPCQVWERKIHHLLEHHQYLNSRMIILGVLAQTVFCISMCEEPKICVELYNKGLNFSKKYMLIYSVYPILYRWCYDSFCINIFSFVSFERKDSMKAEDKFDFDIFPTPDKTSFQGSIYSQGFKVFVVWCPSLIWVIDYDS